MERLFVPGTLEAALERLDRDRLAQPIAGGVGVLLARALGEPTPARWVAVGRLAELRELRPDVASAGVVLGAATTLDELARGPSQLIPALLAASARSVASPGVRVVATLGGNIVAGRGRSDLAAALLALDAEVELAGPAGNRRLPLETWLAGELGSPPGGDWPVLRAVRLPARPVGWGWRRLTVRGAMDRSVASVAVAVGPAGRRVAVSCAADRPFRIRSAEAEAVSDADELARAVERDLESVALTDDERASADYRRRVLPVLVARALAEALTRDRPGP
ncbi:MAG TPA: FAD binding domain-containing protein [Candidatus Limnocylindrales bacterium]|nr:FAD binding domain-containing protein [Candidatus Limnocylindrales bacterium]